jgi:hypothetical protein
MVRGGEALQVAPCRGTRMTVQRPPEEQFLNDVSNHVMTIVRDDGVHRHLHFAKPGSGDMHFDIVTYPGYLVYSGDMGCYVFSRLRDMFEFFRTRPRDEPERLFINLSYWAEKLEATDKPDGHLEYSADLLRERVTEILDDIEADQELRDEVEEYVLAYADDGEVRARDALDQFEHNGRRVFTDTWEWDLTEYTFRFVWCCYALAWAIKQYDAVKAKAVA